MPDKTITGPLQNPSSLDPHSVRAEYEYQLSVTKARLEFLSYLRKVFGKNGAHPAGHIEIRTITADDATQYKLFYAGGIRLQDFQFVYKNILDNLTYIFACDQDRENIEKKKLPNILIANGRYLPGVAAEIAATFNLIASAQHRIPKELRQEYAQELCNYLVADLRIFNQKLLSTPVQIQDAIFKNIDFLEKTLRLEEQQKTTLIHEKLALLDKFSERQRKDILRHKKLRIKQLIQRIPAIFNSEQYEELDNLLYQTIALEHDRETLEFQHKICIEKACIKFLDDLAKPEFINNDDYGLVISGFINDIHNDPNQTLELLPPELPLSVKNKLRDALNEALLIILRDFNDYDDNDLDDSDKQLLAYTNKPTEGNLDSTVRPHNSKKFLSEKISGLKKCAKKEIKNCQKQIELIGKNQPTATPPANHETTELFKLVLEYKNAPAARLLLKHGARPDLEYQDDTNGNNIFHVVAQPLKDFEPADAYQNSIKTLIDLAKDSKAEQHPLLKPNKASKTAPALTALAIIEATERHETIVNQQVQARYKKIEDKFKLILEDLHTKLAKSPDDKKLHAKISAVLAGMNEFAAGKDLKTVQANLLNNENILKKRNWWSVLQATTAKEISKLDTSGDEFAAAKLTQAETAPLISNKEAEQRALIAARNADQARNQRIEYLEKIRKCQALLHPIKNYLIKQRAKDETDYDLLKKKVDAVEAAIVSISSDGEFSQAQQTKLKETLGQERNPHSFWKSKTPVQPKSLQLLENALHHLPKLAAAA